MSFISNIVFMPWFNKDEREAIDRHAYKNFTYIQYKDTKKGGTYTERLNTKTNEVMWKDAPSLIAFKCLVFAFLYVPIGCALREVHLVGRGIVNLTTLHNFKEAPKDGFNMVKALFFSIGLFFAAIGGVFTDPMKARKRIGLLELKMNQGIDLKTVRKNEEGGKCSFETFYLAQCMQPVVSDISDKRWNELKRSANYKEVKTDSEGTECPCQRWLIVPVIPFCT